MVATDIRYENRSSSLTRVFESDLWDMAHIHKELEVIYVLEGKTVAYADKNSYLLNKGDTFIAFPNQIHYYNTLKSGKFMVLIFSPDIIYGIGSEISKSKPDINVVTSEKQAISEISEKIAVADGRYMDSIMSGYINIMMGIMLPYMTLKTVDTEKNSAFYSLIDYCTRNFKEDITLDSVAHELHLSKYYISHLINSKLKQNFNGYINGLRIAEACNILKSTDTKIADISEDVGFGTIRSFNRAFKQEVGMSPAEYRANIERLKELI